MRKKYHLSGLSGVCREPHLSIFLGLLRDPEVSFPLAGSPLHFRPTEGVVGTTGTLVEEAFGLTRSNLTAL